MKQEASKKNKKWLWLVLGLVALLAVAGVVLALVFGGGSGDADKTSGGRPELYWNVDRQSHLDPDTGLSNREAAPDGLFYITFAVDGEQVEYAVADKKTVNVIDSMDIMGLVFDNDDMIVDIINPTDIATEVGKGLYVQSVSGNLLVANSSIAMNGMRFNINLGELTEIYEVSGDGEFEGVKIEAAELQAMDTITIYANDLEDVTHIYVINHPDESAVYWRATQKYSSTNKSTTREPDENGDYTMDFYCEGEYVEFKTKDEAVATKIDKTSRYSAHFGLRFDEDGYIVEVLDSAISSRTMLACQRFDITELDGETFTATRLLTNDGSSYTGTITADTRIYDVSGASKSEGRMGKAVESIQMGDRVCVWTDTNGNVVLIYVANRLVDSPAYYLPTRKYSSKTAMTTLEPNSRGVYEVELLREGDSENTIYKTTDVELVNQIMKPTDKCVGLKVDENNNIIYVYDVEALFGYTYFCRGRYISETAGVIASFLLPSDLSVKNGVLASGCKFYNVSKVGDYGAETTLQVGDYVYCWKQPTGEVIHGYVIRRYIGEDTQYYNLTSKYDKETMTSTREPAEDGWYYFTMAHMGKQVTLKTKDKAIVDAIDILGASLPVAALQLSGDVITGVLDPTYSTGGAKVASGYRIKSFNADGSITAYYKEKEVTFSLAEDVQIYNVSSVVESYKGEKGTLKVGDMITAFTNWEGKATIVWIRGRQVDNMYWKYDRFYSNDATSRVPDADGWYWYDLAVNGECKRLKTKDIEVANSMDKYEGAFGLHVVGDEIKGFLSVGNVKDASGNGVTNWTVTKINGKEITLTYTYEGSNLGKTQTITLASDAKIYDVSGSDLKTFGAKTTLKVGDLVRTYLSEDGETHQYVYVRGRCTRKDGYMSYCDHCDKVVYWNPYMKNSSVSTNNHYYLPADIENTSQITYGSTSKEYEAVLDLNGHTLSRSNGRVFLVRYGEILNIIDTAGGGKIVGAGNNAGGGAFLINDAVLNLYGGTITMTEDENVKALYGGCISLSGENGVVNMYGGTLIGGRATMSATYTAARGGNLYVSKGTFNMYGGTITGGKAYDGQEPVLDDAGNPKLDDEGKVKTSVVRALGGNIYVATGGTLNITGGQITDGWSESWGGNIYSASTANIVNLSGVTVSGGYAGYRAGNLGLCYGTSTIGGGTKVLGGFAGAEKVSGYGGNLVVYTGKVTINDAVIDGGEVGYHGTGGNIYCLYEGTLTLNKGSVVSNGTSYGNGGNIYVAGNQYAVSTERDRQFNLTINGGTVTGGTSTNGSGGNICMSGASVDVDEDGTKEYVGGSFFYMTAGEVSGGICAADKYAGNLYLEVDEAKISGGKIFGGKQADNEYDIYVTGNGKNITVSGGEVAGKFRVNALDAVTVEGNPVLGQLNLAKNAMITVGELKEGAEIAVMVTASTPGGVFTNAFNKAQDYLNAGYFTAYEAGKMVDINTDDELCVVTERIVDPNAETAYCEHCKKDVAWSGWNYFSGSGHYYLNDTWILNNAPNYVAEGEDIIIDLKGLSITANDNLAFDVEGTLSIIDTVGGGMITGTGPSSGTAHGGVIRVNGGTLNLYSGVLKMADNQYNMAGGGVVYVSNDAIFNMYGGELAGGEAFGNPNSTNTNTQKGRGANLYNTGSVCNLYGGKIYGGKAGIGGNIYNGTNGVINFAGTEVSGGEATKSSGGNVYSESGELNFSASSITGGVAVSTGNDVYCGSASLAVNITGGSIAGEVYIRSVDSVTVSGAPTVGKLIMHSSELLTLGEITGGSIMVKADGVFTGVLSNPNAYLTYISASESGKKVAVTTAGELTIVEDSGSGSDSDDEPVVDPTETAFNDVYAAAVQQTADGVFASGEAVTAPCPYCSANGDTADKQWTVLTAISGNTVLVADHYYLAESLEDNGGYYDVTGSVCLHLNGNNITNTNGKLVFYSNKGPLNVMGDGVISSNRFSSSSAYSASVIDSIGDVNLCGGTYVTTGVAPAIGGRGTSTDGVINVYEGTTITQAEDRQGAYALISVYYKTTLNIYGGSIIGGVNTSTSNFGGNICIKGSTYSARASALNIYGGTITGGSSEKGGSIYAVGGANPVDVTITGGTITGGSVYIDSVVTNATISGTAQIENLDLSDGAVISLGTLSGDASIAVKADGVFTGALSNASDYLTYISAYEEGKKVEVTSNNTLSVVSDSGEEEEAPTPITAYCEHCEAEKEWIPMSVDYMEDSTANVSKKLVANDNNQYHFYLADDFDMPTGTKNSAKSGYQLNIGTKSDSSQQVCLDLNGKTWTAPWKGFLVYGTLSIQDSSEDETGCIVACGNGTAAGVVQISAGGTLNVYGGTLKQAEGTTMQYGGLFTNAGTLNIYGGILADAVTTEDGGAIAMKSADAVLNISGATIINCTSGTASGSAIYASKGDVSISDSVIQGEVFLTDGVVSATISGETVIEQLSSNMLVTFQDLAEGACIAVNEDAGTVFNNPCVDAQVYVDAGYITSAVAYYEVAVNADNGMSLVEMVCPCGCNTPASQIDWTAFSESLITDTKYIASGHYYLAEDYTTAQYLVVGTSSDNTLNVVIDLRGNNWTNTAGRAFSLYGTLSVMDTVGGGEIAGSSSAANGSTIIVTGGTLNLHSGTLTAVEGSEAKYGGVLSFGWHSSTHVRATFNMYGGKITGGNSVGDASNKGKGGNIYLSYTDFTMTGGIITAGESTGTGGNIHGLSSSTANITGGIISGGNAGTRGGNIYLESGTYTISNAVITGGTATNQGGDICVNSGSAILTLTDVVVTGELNLRVCDTVTVAGKTQIGQVTAYTSSSGTPVLTLGELTDGASIVLNNTGALTAANDNAQAYIEAGYISAYEGIVLSVEDNVIIGAEAAAQ